MQRRTAKWLDESFFQLLGILEVENFLECGARDGKASQRFLNDVGFKAVAVEANPLTWERLTRKAERKGVTTINCGVGAEDEGVCDFFMPRGNPTAGNASFMQKAGEQYETQKLRTRTIDGLWREHFPSEQSIALWIDVEGMASEVLRGAGKLFDTARCVALKVEVETREHWRGQRLASDIDAYLGNCGYRPVLCDFEYDDQFNVIYVRQDAVDKLESLLHESLFSLSKRRVTLIERLFKSRQYLSRRERKARRNPRDST